MKLQFEELILPQAAFHRLTFPEIHHQKIELALTHGPPSKLLLDTQSLGVCSAGPLGDFLEIRKFCDFYMELLFLHGPLLWQTQKSKNACKSLFLGREHPKIYQV